MKISFLLAIALIILSSPGLVKASRPEPKSTSTTLDFCAMVDSVESSIIDGSDTYLGAYISENDSDKVYQSTIKFTTNGDALIYVSKADSLPFAFDEMIANNMTLDQAKVVYHQYFDQIKNCIGEDFTETTDADGTLHASDNLFIYYDIGKDYENEGKYAVYFDFVFSF